MKSRVQHFALAALATAALATTAPTAFADTSLYVQAGPPPVYVMPSPRLYAYDGHDYDRFARHGCDAPRWDPNARYMPGQAVRRLGKLYVATEESAHRWNVNSPPEWTPDYWVRARCR
jgi:hypothetical protein